MDIDQLRENIAHVSGGIEWTAGPGNSGLDLLNKYSATLGVPDYFQSTREDTDPSLIFQKFLSDAAQSVCTKLIDLESTGTGNGTFLSGVTAGDTWSSNPTAIEANIILQIKRFHGKEYAAGDVLLDDWTWLFQTVHSRTGETEKAWRAVCVALVLHPYFYTY